MTVARRAAALLGVSVLLAGAGATAAHADETTPPVLSEFSATPSTLPWQGGNVDLAIEVVDEDGVSSVGASVQLATGGALSVALAPVDVDATGSGTYTGSVTIPSNIENWSVSHSVEVSATDDHDALAMEIVGSIEVEGQPQFDEEPVVSDIMASPSYLPPAGGEVTITATATDNSSISEVNAVVAGTHVPMEAISSTTFQGTWTAPPNSSPQDVTHPVYVTAFDDIGQSGGAEGGPVTVAGVATGEDTAPLITGGDVTPAQLPSSGGTATISVTAIDDIGITMAYADVFVSGDDLQSVQLLYAGDDTYSGQVNLPPNANTTEVVWGVTVTVTDTNGAFDSEDLGTVTVAGQPAPQPLEVSATDLRFGKVDVGTRRTMELELTNPSGASGPVSGTLRGLAKPFRLVGSSGDPLNYSLDPGESVVLTIRYAPRRAGAHSDELRITRTDGQPRLEIPVRGRGR